MADQLRITTRIIAQTPSHTEITVWQNGGNAGTLTVDTDVADQLCDCLNRIGETTWANGMECDINLGDDVRIIAADKTPGRKLGTVDEIDASQGLPGMDLSYVRFRVCFPSGFGWYDRCELELASQPELEQTTDKIRGRGEGDCEE